MISLQTLNLEGIEQYLIQYCVIFIKNWKNTKSIFHSFFWNPVRNWMLKIFDEKWNNIFKTLPHNLAKTHMNISLSDIFRQIFNKIWNRWYLKFSQRKTLKVLYNWLLALFFSYLINTNLILREIRAWLSSGLLRILSLAVNSSIVLVCQGYSFPKCP